MRKVSGCGAHVILLFQKVQNSPVKWTNIISDYIQKGGKNTEDTDWLLKKKIIPRILIKSWPLNFQFQRWVIIEEDAW